MKINKIFKEVVYKFRNCKIDGSNIIKLPHNIKLVKNLKIVIKGSNNIIDLSQIKDIKHKSLIEIRGSNNKLILNSLETKGTGRFEIKIHGDFAKLIMQENVSIDEGLYLFQSSNTQINIGANTSFFKTTLQCIHAETAINIGEDCMFSYDTWVYNSDGHPIVDKDNNITNKPKNINIGKHVWIGWSASILKGVSIGDNSIIGRSAVVTKSNTEPNSIIAGNPAKAVKRLEGTWLREDINFLKPSLN